MKIEDNVINEIFDKLIKKSDYKKRVLEVKKFNLKNNYQKKESLLLLLNLAYLLQQYT